VIEAHQDHTRKTAAATQASNKFWDKVEALASPPTCWRFVEAVARYDVPLYHQLCTELNPWNTVSPALSSNYVQLVHAGKELGEKHDEEFLDGAETDQQDQDSGDDNRDALDDYWGQFSLLRVVYVKP
jgi:hypothetical protein